MKQETYTIKEFADKAGVSWQTVASWKRFKKFPEGAITPDGHLLKAVVDPLLESGVLQNSASESPPQKSVARSSKKESAAQSFEEFARSYWQEGTKAVDVLLMTSETGGLLINHVNNALRFAWDKLR